MSNIYVVCDVLFYELQWPLSSGHGPDDYQPILILKKKEICVKSMIRPAKKSHLEPLARDNSSLD